MKICGVSGSFRELSLNTSLLRAVKEIAAPDHIVEIAEYQDIPLYNGDVEAAGMPDSVTRFAEAIRDADALLIVTPEYNAGIPGVLKNAMDWASRVRPNVYDNKPTAILGASPGRLGSVRAQLQLRINLANLNAKVVAQPMIYVGEAGQFFAGDAPGLDVRTTAQVTKLLEALEALV